MTNALRNLFHTSANITTLQPVVSAPAWHADAACMGTLLVCIKVAIVVLQTTILRNSTARHSFMFVFWSQPHPCESVVVLEIARRCGVWLHSPLLAHCLSVRVRIHALLVCNMAFPTTQWRFMDVSQSFVLCPCTRMCCAYHLLIVIAPCTCTQSAVGVHPRHGQRIIYRCVTRTPLAICTTRYPMRYIHAKPSQ